MTMIPKKAKSQRRELAATILARNNNNKMTKFTYKELRTENEVSIFIFST